MCDNISATYDSVSTMSANSVSSVCDNAYTGCDVMYTSYDVIGIISDICITYQ